MALKENEITGKIIEAAIQVHRAIGPGLLESAYCTLLMAAIQKGGLNIRSQLPVPVVFEGTRLECGYRLDLLVENKVVIEVRSVETLNPVHFAQLLTYLRLGDYKVGLLINFNVDKLTSGIKRIVNGL